MLKIFNSGKTNYDFLLLISVIFISCFGLLMVYSTSSVYALEVYGDPSRFLKLHLIYLTLGLAAMVMFMHIDYRILRKFVYPAYIICLILLIVVLIPGVGKKVSGAQRWLVLGPLTFQPSEIAKFVILLYLAHSLDKKRDMIDSFSVGFLSHILVAGTFIALIFVEPDFGTSVTILILLIMMMFIGNVKIRYIMPMLVLAAGFSVMAILTKSYRMDRLLSFLDPWKDPLGSGYQAVQSFIAFGVGGLYGMGLGDSTQKLFFLPQAHTDFIFSIIGEELGFIGVVAIIATFLFILYRSIRIGIKAPDLFGCYLVCGFTLLIAIQAAMNMAVSVGLFPTKGLTLPFISYGGSSLVCSLAAMGIILSVSKAEVK
ncbi:MAG: putative lipid II flippase FtsW [Thermodesulfobacteriota bacterium]